MFTPWRISPYERQGLYILCAPSMALVSKIPKYSSGRKSLTGELGKPVSKSQGGLPRIPKGHRAEPEWVVGAVAQGPILSTTITRERLAKSEIPVFVFRQKYLQNLMTRCIRGRLACPEESKGTVVSAYAEASADKCESALPIS
jgi:hypothetical protein